MMAFSSTLVYYGYWCFVNFTPSSVNFKLYPVQDQDNKVRNKVKYFASRNCNLYDYTCLPQLHLFVQRCDSYNYQYLENAYAGITFNLQTPT